MVCEGGLVLSFKELTVRELDSVLVKLFKLGLESKSPSISHFLGYHTLVGVSVSVWGRNWSSIFISKELTVRELDSNVC